MRRVLLIFVTALFTSACNPTDTINKAFKVVVWNGPSRSNVDIGPKSISLGSLDKAIFNALYLPTSSYSSNTITGPGYYGGYGSGYGSSGYYGNGPYYWYGDVVVTTSKGRAYTRCTFATDRENDIYVGEYDNGTPYVWCV